MRRSPWTAARITAIGVFALVLAACGREPGPLTVTEADSGRTISLVSGQGLVLELASNPTTGFRWNLVGEPDPDVLSLESFEFEPPSETGLVGAGGTEIWTFSAARGGRTALHLLYERPFAPQELAGRFDLVVEVSEG